MTEKIINAILFLFGVVLCVYFTATLLMGMYIGTCILIDFWLGN